VVHTRFSRWAACGVWKKVFEHLASEADNEYAMINSTIVRAHQHSAGARKKKGQSQAIGRSKGGLSTKIHATVDALGNPIGFHLTEGQACELDGADVLLPQLEARTVIADKGFAGADFEALMAEFGQALDALAILQREAGGRDPRSRVEAQRKIPERQHGMRVTPASGPRRGRSRRLSPLPVNRRSPSPLRNAR